MLPGNPLILAGRWLRGWSAICTVQPRRRLHGVAEARNIAHGLRSEDFRSKEVICLRMAPLGRRRLTVRLRIAPYTWGLRYDSALEDNVHEPPRWGSSG